MGVAPATTGRCGLALTTTTDERPIGLTRDLTTTPFVGFVVEGARPGSTLTTGRVIGEALGGTSGAGFATVGLNGLFVNVVFFTGGLYGTAFVHFVTQAIFGGGGLVLAATVAAMAAFARSLCFIRLWFVSPIRNCKLGDKAMGLQIAQSRGLGQATKWYKRCLTFRHQGNGQTSNVDVVPGQSRTCNIRNLTLLQQSRWLVDLCLDEDD